MKKILAAMLAVLMLVSLVACDAPAETTGSDWLTLYLADGGKCRIDTASPKHGYDVARVIRSHVPHLLYGPDETYRSLFREDPQKLLELARKKSGENV